MKHNEFNCDTHILNSEFNNKFKFRCKEPQRNGYECEKPQAGHESEMSRWIVP